MLNERIDKINHSNDVLDTIFLFFMRILFGKSNLEKEIEEVSNQNRLRLSSTLGRNGEKIFH